MSTLFLVSNTQMFSQPAEGIVDRLITHNQIGRVKYRGTYWSAQLYQPEYRTCILAGEPVTIIAIRGITLLVAPVI